jgi:hypothetical protein
MQESILAYKKLEYCKHMKEKTTHRFLRIKVWQEKLILLILIYFSIHKGTKP